MSSSNSSLLPCCRLVPTFPLATKLGLDTLDLLRDVLAEVVHAVQLGSPSDALAPVCDSSSIRAVQLKTAVILLNLLWREARRLGAVGPLVVVQSSTDGVCGRKDGVLACNTHVVPGGTVTDVALLRSSVYELVQVTEVADVDMSPDVGTF